MPYVTCHHCTVSAYTAARWTSVDRCPACDEPLVRPVRIGLPAVAVAPPGVPRCTVPAGVVASAACAPAG